jgi:hypothetical protein
MVAGRGERKDERGEHLGLARVPTGLDDAPLPDEVRRGDACDEEDGNDEHRRRERCHDVVEPRVPPQSSQEPQHDPQRNRPHAGQEHELPRDGKALLDDLVDRRVAVDERGPEVEGGDVPDVVSELDEPRILQAVVLLELRLERRRHAFVLEPEGAAAHAAQESEGDGHDEQEERDAPERAADDDPGQLSLLRSLSAKTGARAGS